MSIFKFITHRLNRKNNLSVVSCQETLRTAKSVSGVNARRRNRSVQPAFDSCEERVVPAALLAGVAGGLITEAIGITTQFLLENLTGLGNQSEFDQINTKLDNITSKIDTIEKKVRVIEGNTNQIILQNIIRPLKISEIEDYWDKLNILVDKRDTVSQDEVEEFADNVITSLGSTPNAFRNAFNGGGGLTPLMKAYSNVVRTTGTMRRTNRNGDMFLDTNYSEAMVQGFQHYALLRTRALKLLEMAYEYKNSPYLDSVRQQIQNFSPNRSAYNTWVNKHLPKYMIPDFLILDTGTNRVWTQFNINVLLRNGGDGYTVTKPEDYLQLWVVTNYLSNNFYEFQRNDNFPPEESRVSLHGINKEQSVALKNVGNSIKKVLEGLPSYLNFKFQIPTKTDLAGGAEFYVARGFNPSVYEDHVWTRDDSGISKITPGGDAIYMTLNYKPNGKAVYYVQMRNKQAFFI